MIYDPICPGFGEWDMIIPGDGPFLKREEIKPGARLCGLAPIGIQWWGKMGPKGIVRPDGDCPASEFALTHAIHDNRWHEVIE